MNDMKENKENTMDEELPGTPSQRPRTQFLLFWGQLFLLILLPCFGSSACNRVDSESLLSLDFKVSLPLNWSASSYCCSREGISCHQDYDHHDQRVIRLWLPGRGLTGVISPSITNLTHLTTSNIPTIPSQALSQRTFLPPSLVLSRSLTWASIVLSATYHSLPTKSASFKL